MQAPFRGRDPLWAEAEYDGVFAFADGSRLEARFRGLCPLQGVLTDPQGRRWRVAYTGHDWLATDLRPVERHEVAARARATDAQGRPSHPPTPTPPRPQLNSTPRARAPRIPAAPAAAPATPCPPAHFDLGAHTPQIQASAPAPAAAIAPGAPVRRRAHGWGRLVGRTCRASACAPVMTRI